MYRLFTNGHFQGSFVACLDDADVKRTSILFFFGLSVCTKIKFRTRIDYLG